MAIRRRVVVHGDVQGVFFRDSTEKEAKARGVAGWVTNRDDGAVDAVFEGSDDAVEALVEFCRSGPSQADVRDVDVSEEEPEGLDGFSVRGLPQRLPAREPLSLSFHTCGAQDLHASPTRNAAR